MTIRTIDDIFRDFIIDGVPASGPFNPHKPDIRDTLKALLEGLSAFPDNRVIRLNNANEGTANNIVVSSSVEIPAAAYQVLYILNVTLANTGPVKVSGAINRDLVTNINRPITTGYLTPGMALLCIDTGTELRLLSYGDAEAILTAAEEAAARAEAAAAGLNLPVIQPGDAGKSLIVNPDEDGYELGSSNAGEYESRTIVKETNVPETARFLRTAGYYAPGDGGGALYRERKAPEADGYGDITSLDGTRWAVVLDDEIDIRQFGGKLNDDAFDNAPILQEVLKLGTVKIPGNATLSCLTSVDVSDTNVCISGKNQSTSHLQFVGSVNGFVGTHGAPASGKPLPVLILDNLALVTTNDPAVNQNTAIDVTYPEGFFAARFMMYGSAHRCAFRGLNTELNGWGAVMRSDNMLNYNFIDCVFNGKDEGGALDQTPAKKKRSLFGVRMSGGWVPCEVHFTNCQFYHFNESVYTTGSYEGLYLTDCAFVSVGTGIRQIATTFSPNWPGAGGIPVSAVGRPFITVKGTHMNVYDKGIHSSGVVQGIVQGGAFYQSDHATSDADLINIESGHDWEVSGSVFRSYAASAKASGVIVGANAGYVNIHDNNFDTKGIGIWVKAGGTGKNRERNNTFKGSYSVAAIYEEVPNLISHGQRSISLYRSAEVSIANGGAAISWDVIGHNDFATFTAGGSAITIASGSGVKRVRVTAGCVFNANGTGGRQLQIRKNGNQAYFGAAMTPLVSPGAGSCPLNVFTGVLNVNEGDTISFFAYQDSGAALSLQGAGLTWLNIEIVE